MHSNNNIFYLYPCSPHQFTFRKSL